MSARDAAATALEAHGAFEAREESFVATTAAFEAAVRVVADVAAAGSGAVALAVTVRVPTIDAAVAGETVAPVVRDGWLETFERRVGDLRGVTRLEPTPPTVERAPGGDTVVVETTLPAEEPETAAADAKAVVDFVEGTYVQGIIPGYTYREPVAGLVDRARSAGSR